MGLEALLRTEARRSAALPAFVTPDGERSFGDFESRAAALACGLAKAGIHAGDGVGVCLKNCVEFFESMYAVWKLGAYAVPMQARLHPREIAFLVADSEISALIASGSSLATLAEHDDQVLVDKVLVSVGESGDAPWIPYEGLVATAVDDDLPEQDWGDASLAWLFYTSGTTGRPKGACWTRGNITFHRMQYLIESYRFSPVDRYLLWAPATHGAGIFGWFALTCGSAIVIPDLQAGNGPPTLGQAISELSITSLFATPTMIKVLSDELDAQDRSLPSLRHVFYGGSTMPLEHLRQAVKRLGQVFNQGYAQAECGGSISALSADDHREALENPALAHRLESAGRPREGTRVRVVDDAGNDVEPGGVGEIMVTGPTVVHEYWRQPRATRETFRDSWVMTGDLGRLDADGYLYVVGRKRDVIMSGGMNVYPAEIEQVLVRHPGVSECAVIGLPHEVYGEATCAVVVRHPGSSPTEGELITFLLDHLAKYKKPRSVVFVDELPKNENGKVQKSVLQQRYSTSERGMAK